MRRLNFVVLLIAVSLLGSPAWTGDACQYAHIVDPCEKRVVILPTEESSEAYQVHLDEGPAADYEPRAVTLGTVPGLEEFHMIVAQGPYLHKVLYGSSNNDGTIDVFATIDLSAALPQGIPPIEVTGLHAADPIEVNGETYHLLYAVGNAPEPDPQPWVLILNQEVVLNWPYDPSPLLLAAAQIGEIGGTAVDVAAGASFDEGHSQEGFVSVLSMDGRQRFYRIIIEDGVGFGLGIDPWNVEGTWFEGSEPEAIGLDFDSLGLEAHGTYQTSSVVSDLYTGESSCDLVGDPTDVAIWGPDSWGGYVHFVSVSNGAGAGTLLGYNEGSCPYSGYDPPELAPDALGATLHSRPLSLALSSDTSDSVWVYTANGSGDVAAVLLSIVEDAAGATITVVDQFHVDTEGCPSAIVFRDPAHEECVTGKVGDPRPTPTCPTTKFCRDNPDNPLCVYYLCARPNIR